MWIRPTEFELPLSERLNEFQYQPVTKISIATAKWHTNNSTCTLSHLYRGQSRKRFSKEIWKLPCSRYLMVTWILIHHDETCCCLIIGFWAHNNLPIVCFELTTVSFVYPQTQQQMRQRYSADIWLGINARRLISAHEELWKLKLLIAIGFQFSQS